MQACVWDRENGARSIEVGGKQPISMETSPALALSRGLKEGGIWLERHDSQFSGKAAAIRQNETFYFFATIYLTGLIFAGIFWV